MDLEHTSVADLPSRVTGHIASDRMDGFAVTTVSASGSS